ncbi:putative uncharacterized protein DDB_G0282133 [Leptopilina heterotoma]|uniref:putative uncharacterized protein DDB_G0282133 n=1 Tax=Leptopilina heterotoma TaxID=63436 RepID=UPI001CA9B5F8|nr:putative uncharacterized protein DDB_G0282133 [Leptopilina heterotoma]
MKYVCMLLYTLFAPLSYSIETHESWIHNDIQEQLQTSESALDDVENKFEHEHCKAVGHIGFDAYTSNDCVFSCNSRPVGKSITFDEFLGKWVTYVKVFAPDGYDCRNDGYCLGGQCTEKTITIVNTSSTDFTDSWKESTSPKRDKKSSDFTSPSSDGVISSLDSKTTRDLITNDDSSYNNTISNDIDYFKGSTTPEIISHFNNITTPPSGTTFDASEPVGLELQIMNEHCERAKEGYFFALLPNKCFIACTLDKYLAYHPDKDNDDTYQTVREITMFLENYKEVFINDGQCVKRTTADSNTISTDVTDSVKESTTPKSVASLGEHISLSTDGITSSLDSTTPCYLITNDDSSDNKTISNDIDDSKGSTTPKSILNFNNATTTDSNTISTNVTDFEKESTTPESIGNSSGHISSSSNGVTSSLDLTTPRYLLTKDHSSDNKTISKDINDFKESTTPKSNLNLKNATTTDSNTISTNVTDFVKESTTPESFGNSSDHISSSSNGITSSLDSTTPRYLLTNDHSSDNKTISKDINDFKESTTPKSNLNLKNATTTDSNTISTNVTDFVKVSTTPESFGNSSDHISSSSNGITSSLDSTTPRYLLTNDHSSDNKTISKDINDFKESTTPKSNLNLKNATTTDSNTISTNVTDFVKVSTTPESFGNSSDHISSFSNGITSSLDSTTPRYLLTNDHSSDNKTISKDINDFKESTTPKSNLNLKNATTTDSNTISTNVTDFVKESTTPESFGNSSDHISSSSNGITSSLDSTTPRHLITNDDSSDNKTSSKGIDDFKESTTRKSILNFNNATTPQSGTTSGTSYPVRQKLTDSDTTDKMTTLSSESDGFNNNVHNSRTSLPIDTVNKELSTPKYSTISNTLKSPHRELQILNEQCNRYGLYYFFSYPDNKCVLACTASEFLAYHPSKQNNFFYQTLSRFNIQVNNYGQISVQDGLKCSDNGYCQNGQCLEKIKSVTPSFLSMEAFFGLSNNECKKIGTYGAYSVSSIDCALNCMMINPYSGYLTINQKVAPNGFPCSNNRICHEGTCRRISKEAIYTIRRY